MPVNIENAATVSENYSLYPVYAWFEDGTLYLYTKSDKIYLNQDSESLFDGLLELTSLDLSKFDTYKVINMSHIFANCNKITEFDLSTFDTSNVTDMSGLFGNDFELETITFGPNFNTSNVIYMNNMFHNIEARSVDLSNFDTRKVVDMSWMFCGSMLTSLDLSSFDTSNVENMYGMIANMPLLAELNLGNNFDTSNVTNMSQLFRNLGELEVLDLGDKFNVENVTEYAWMFANDVKEVTKTIKSKNDLVFSSALDTNFDLFVNTKLLTGGYGTSWKNINIKKNYAVIDCGSKRPGYLTYSGTQEEYEQFCSQFD